MNSALAVKSCQIPWREQGLVYILKTAPKVGSVRLDHQARIYVHAEITQMNKLYYGQDVY